MVSAAKKYNAPAQLYLSHSTDKLRNPLTYDSKVYWVNKAFGNKVDVVQSDDRTVFEILKTLSNEGYTDVIYVGGGDRIGGEGDISQQILRYNGTPGKNGEIPYSFNSIKFVNAGNRNDRSDDLIERASASAARAAVVNGNFESFKELVPFNEKDADNLFRQLYVTMVDGELPESLHMIPPRDDLFNEALVYGDNDNEFFSEEDRYLFEDINVGNTTISEIKNLVEPELKKQLDIILRDKYKTTQTKKKEHPFELIRLGNNAESGSNLTETDLKQAVIKAYDKMPKHYTTLKQDGFSLDNELGEYAMHSGEKSSGTFNSFEVSGKTDGGDKFTIYITIKSGRGSDKKAFTPGKVLDNKDRPLARDEIKINDRYSKNFTIKTLLETLVNEAHDENNIIVNKQELEKGINYITKGSKTVPSDVNLIFNCPKSGEIFNSLPEMQRDSISSGLYTDFTEVIGAVCLSTALGEDTKVEFPNSSTEKLIDYIIYDKLGNKIKVSAKKDDGGKPSVTGLIDLVNSDPDISDEVKSFINWFKDEHLNVPATGGFLNVAEKMVNIIEDPLNVDFSWEKRLPRVTSGNEISKQYRLARKGDAKALAELKNLINTNIRSLGISKPSYIDNLYPVGTNKNLLDLESWIPNKAIFCMGKLFINLVNASPLVKDLYNSFTKVFGTFIQAYCIAPNLSTGQLKFKIVFTTDTNNSNDSGHRYILLLDCANNIPDGRMVVKKIAMKLI